MTLCRSFPLTDVPLWSCYPLTVLWVFKFRSYSFVIKQNQINYMLTVKWRQLHILRFYNISADFTFYYFQRQTGCKGESSYWFVNDKRDKERFGCSSGKFLSLPWSQNHRTAEAGRDLRRLSSLTLLLKEGSAGPGPCPVDFLVFPRMKTPQTLCRICSSTQHQWKSALLCFKGISCIVLCEHCFLSFHWAPLRRVCLHLLFCLPRGIYAHW